MLNGAAVVVMVVTAEVLNGAAVLLAGVAVIDEQQGEAQGAGSGSIGW